MDAETWHIPIRNDLITIDQALQSMEDFKLNQDDVPFIIRLFENPKYNLLPGCVTLQSHDIIHVLLGRGLLPKDEAFVLGFTMGSTKKVSKIHKLIFKFVTKYLYPEGYTFRKDEHDVFEQGLQLASNMNCPDLSKVDLIKLIGYNIREARKELGINVTKLQMVYGYEKIKYTTSPESQRLL